MTPDLTNPYHRAYAEVFGLADVLAEEWPEIEAEMREVAEASTADHAAYLLAGWGYRDRHGDADAAALTVAARDIRRRLGVVDAPHPEADKERAAVVRYLHQVNHHATADAIARGAHREAP